ncbi:uncharacterized protein LOC103316809 [Nasonia vitripennis]|uniref:Uncharacterized protein n=1 Tax=Nasonia vitripennis TaxID=7425 RepID=A0A7M7LUR3_NASVI|nr:uncharacterized protein LOC103316809 [Nasonia vitripennis]
MNYEIDDEIRDFVTSYSKEYGPKRVQQFFRARPFFSEYRESNPIKDAYKEYLNLQKKNERLPPRRRTENPQDLLDRVRSELSHLKTFLPRDPPDEALVERQQKQLFQSAYQIEFAKNLYNCSSALRDQIKENDSMNMTLSEKSAIAETEQKKSFRNPRHVGGDNTLRTQKLMKPPDNLTVDKKEREILRVRTGFSEYQDIIGKAGRRIIQEQFLGPSVPVEVPDEHTRNPDSARSSCLHILRNASKHHLMSQVF